MNFKKVNSSNYQSGQTLVETMVAALVLSIGIGAAVSLAVYGLTATSSIPKQLIGVGLAREGIEAVKNMRDTNWLRTALADDCHNFLTGGGDGLCFKQWLSGSYQIDPGSTPQTYSLGIAGEDPEEEYWRLVATPSRFGLNYTPEATAAEGFYSAATTVTVENTNSGFARKITLEADSTAPFDENTGPRLKVTVDVWWTDRRCPALTATPPTNPNCRVTLETYLTNWKDYN